jgi:hypothetical protein
MTLSSKTSVVDANGKRQIDMKVFPSQSAETVEVLKQIEMVNNVENSHMCDNRRHNIHIPRQKLREILLNNIVQTSASEIEWNKRFVSFLEINGSASQSSKGLRLNFADGSEFDCSTLVACDGIYSSVRNYIYQSVTASKSNSVSLNGQLTYLGLIVILGISPNVLISTHSIFDDTSERVSRVMGRHQVQVCLLSQLCLFCSLHRDLM